MYQERPNNGQTGPVCETNNTLLDKTGMERKTSPTLALNAAELCRCDRTFKTIRLHYSDWIGFVDLQLLTKDVCDFIQKMYVTRDFT